MKEVGHQIVRECKTACYSQFNVYYLFGLHLENVSSLKKGFLFRIYILFSIQFLTWSLTGILNCHGLIASIIYVYQKKHFIGLPYTHVVYIPHLYYRKP